MKFLSVLKTWLLVLIMVAMTSGAASAKVASGGINLAADVHQGLESSKSLNALGIDEVSTMFALDSPLATNKGAKQTLEKRAADLVKRNDNKNRVSISTPNGRTNIDLAGKSHHVDGVNVPTPHVQNFKNNVIPSGPRAGQVGSRSADGATRSATAQDLRTVNKFLKSKGK